MIDANVALIGLSVFAGLGLVGTIVALKFGRAAEHAPLRDWMAADREWPNNQLCAEAMLADAAPADASWGMAGVLYAEDEAPLSQRDTVPCSAPPTPRTGEDWL